MTIQATITTLTLTLSLISGSWTLASPDAIYTPSDGSSRPVLTRLATEAPGGVLVQYAEEADRA